MIDFYRKMIVFSMLMLLSVVFIFSNSLKNSEESHEDSDVIVEVVEDVADKVVPENQLNWSYIVRKSAHIFEFFVLGVFTMLFFSQLDQKISLGILYAIIFVFVIASADEFIQRFTGRTSCFQDVAIDVLGASIGIGFILLLRLLKKGIINRMNGTVFMKK